MLPSAPLPTTSDLPWYAPLWDVEENTPYRDIPELDDEFDDADYDDDYAEIDSELEDEDDFV